MPHGSLGWIYVSLSTIFSGNSLPLKLRTDKDVQLWTETEQDSFRLYYETHITITSKKNVACIKSRKRARNKPAYHFFQGWAHWYTLYMSVGEWIVLSIGENLLSGSARSGFFLVKHISTTFFIVLHDDTEKKTQVSIFWPNSRGSN